ncbi:Hypothetical protein ING2D1G_0359 [Peptoniphilus sp. ING2-D1G]|nr:Hypothetical protein ING2D1G_0359 [Peptoniphilus sp. ING2-D1G]
MNIKGLLAIVPLSLALVACGGKDTSNTANVSNTDDNSAPQVTEPKTENTKNNAAQNQNVDEKTAEVGNSIYVNASTKLTGADAAKIFSDKYPNAQIESVEYDTEEYKYEISAKDAEKEYEIKINPESGEIIAEEFENDRDDDEFLTTEQIAKAEDFLNKAVLNSGEGFLVKSWDMDIDDGICEIDIELKGDGGSEMEYKYNVDTAELIEKEN